MRESEAEFYIDAFVRDVKRYIYAPAIARRAQVAGVPVDPELLDGTNFLTVQAELTGLEFVSQVAGIPMVEFFKKYFPPEYSKHYHSLWQILRHGHVHLFVPKGVIEAGMTITGQDLWLHMDPEEMQARMDAPGGRGELLAQLKAKATHNGVHLDFIPDDKSPKDRYFVVCPQILYYDILGAVKQWRTDRDSNERVKARFQKGVQHVGEMTSWFEPKQRPKLIEELRALGVLPTTGPVVVVSPKVTPGSGGQQTSTWIG